MNDEQNYDLHGNMPTTREQGMTGHEHRDDTTSFETINVEYF